MKKRVNSRDILKDKKEPLKIEWFILSEDCPNPPSPGTPVTRDFAEKYMEKIE